MNDLDRLVRLFVYEHFATTGTSPSLDDATTAAECTTPGCTTEEIEASLKRLESNHHALTLAPTTNNIWMAHPFSAVPTAFRVESAEVSYWANCAWDAVSIPSMLRLDARVDARCAESGHAIELDFRGGEIADDTDGVVHFVVPPRRFWDNVGYT